MQRIVVKVGTGVLTGGERAFDVERMRDLARQIVALRDAGHQVLLVSSGAVAAGRERVPLDRARRDVPAKQMLAAIGQHRLMLRWDALFEAHDVIVAQTLLTKVDLRDRQGYLNARNTLIGLVEHKVLPIVNENDVVDAAEIHVTEDNRLFRDNDNLAAMVANLVDASLLVNLTNTGGLYTGDPRVTSDAELIAEVERITRDVEALAGGVGTDQGTGGMRTKIEAAKLATASGIAVVIAPGSEPDVLVRVVLKNEHIGTRFRPAVTRRESRKRWILSALTTKAAVQVDAGAAEALRTRGRSLLAPGVRATHGRFGRGDPIAVIDPEGERIACGLANYAASDVEQIKGQHSRGIAELLGYTFGPEVIHRDNLVLIGGPRAERA